MSDGNGFTVKEIVIEFRDETNKRFDDLHNLIMENHKRTDDRFKPLEAFRSKFPSVALVTLVLYAATIAIALLK